MILYLAAGGGLGHLTRMRAFIHTLAIEEPITLLAPPRHGGDRRITGDLIYIPLTDDLSRDLPRYRRWLSSTVEKVAPSRMIVDTFPGGILGELRGLPLPRALPIDLVARAVRWERYGSLAGDSAPRYRTAYLVEPLPHDQLRYLQSRCTDLLPIDLADPASDLDADALLRSLELRSGEFWLIVHSGAEREIMELVAYAARMAAQESRPPRLLLVSPRRPATLDSAILHLDLYPATPLFEHAGRIVSGAGFNVMRQARPWREKHHPIPFERRYDDQTARKERAT